MDTKKSSEDKKVSKIEAEWDKQRAGFDLIERLEFIETLLDVRETSQLSAEELKRRCDRVYQNENSHIITETEAYRQSYKESLAEVLDYLKSKFDFPFEHHPKRKLWESFKNL